MNVQDAIGNTQADMETIRQLITRTEATHQGLAEIEATLAELLGPDNEEVGKIGEATAKTEELQGSLNTTLANLESLESILSSIL